MFELSSAFHAARGRVNIVEECILYTQLFAQQRWDYTNFNSIQLCILIVVVIAGAIVVVIAGAIAQLQWHRMLEETDSI